MTTPNSTFRTIAYAPGVLTLIDQTRLPVEEIYLDLNNVEDVARAIERLSVRGAPAIGVAAAYGMAVAARSGMPLQEAHERLARTRPTAVNLFWALDRMKRLWAEGMDDAEALEVEADAIYAEEVVASQKMGEFGAELIPEGATILTHCNAGALATADYGTALAVIRAAHAAKKNIKVFADETRPLLQGARLTSWELMKDGIDVTLIPDAAVAHLVSKGLIDCAVVGADRVAANGDAANKIGTRGVACLLKEYDKPVYVAAPWSTIDMSLPNGDAIPIEERGGEEITHIGGVRIAPEGVKVRNPAFDITPAEWLAGIITDRGFTGKKVAAGLARQARE